MPDNSSSRIIRFSTFEINFQTQTGAPWRIALISAQGGTPHELLAKKDNLSDPT
jgi:hypothetical protein